MQFQKLHAHWMTKLYRNAYGLHCSQVFYLIMTHFFRGNEFVTKIVRDPVKSLSLKKLNT